MKNVLASVLAKLRTISKSSGAPFQQVLQQYAIERFFIASRSRRMRKSVILKGALLLKTIGIQGARPTMDIDMLRKGKADQASLVALVKDCATLDVEPDGLIYIADSAVAEEITKDSEYKGTRIRMDARMDNVRLTIQIDFGVGDIMVPGLRMIEYPGVPGRRHDRTACVPGRVRNRGKAPGNGGPRQRQQPDERLLRRVDLLESSRLQCGHASQGNRCNIQESRDTRAGRRNSRPSRADSFERIVFSGMRL